MPWVNNSWLQPVAVPSPIPSHLADEFHSNTRKKKTQSHFPSLIRLLHCCCYFRVRKCSLFHRTYLFQTLNSCRNVSIYYYYLRTPSCLVILLHLPTTFLPYLECPKEESLAGADDASLKGISSPDRQTDRTK